MTLDGKTRAESAKETLLELVEWESLLCTLPQENNQQLAHYAVKLREFVDYLSARAEMADYYELPEMAAGARDKAKEIGTQLDRIEAFLEAGGYGA